MLTNLNKSAVWEKGGRNGNLQRNWITEIKNEYGNLGLIWILMMCINVWGMGTEKGFKLKGKTEKNEQAKKQGEENADNRNK